MVVERALRIRSWHGLVMVLVSTPTMKLKPVEAPVLYGDLMSRRS